MPAVTLAPAQRPSALAAVALLHLAALLCLWRAPAAVGPERQTVPPAERWLTLVPLVPRAPAAAPTRAVPVPVFMHAAVTAAAAAPPPERPRPAPRPRTDAALAQPAVPYAAPATPAPVALAPDPLAPTATVAPVMPPGTQPGTRPEATTVAPADRLAQLRAAARIAYQQQRGPQGTQAGRAATFGSADSQHERFVRAFENARTTHWNEAPVITEVRDPNDSGRRITKVRTALGTYCIYEKPNTDINDTNAFGWHDRVNAKTNQFSGHCPRE